MISWTQPAGTALELVSVIDEAVALSGTGNATKYQQLTNTSAINLAAIQGLTVGRTYVVQVTANNGAYGRVSITSTRVTR